MVLTSNNEKMKYIKNYEILKQRLTHLKHAPFYYSVKTISPNNETNVITF